MKYLVTGATGFIGNYVIMELLRKGIHVIATSRNENKARQFPWFSKVAYIPCNLNENKSDFFSHFTQPDCMIHLAWDGLPNYNELYHFEKVMPANYKFIKNMVQHGLKHLVVTGTCQEYGLINGCLSENLETRPGTPYALAKDTLREFLEQLIKKYPITFQWLRLFYIYGDGQSKHSLFSQLMEAVQKRERVFNMSGGEQLRDYLHVKKVADYIVAVSIQNKVQGILNCCSGNPISVLRQVKKILGKNESSIRLNLGYYPYPDYEPMAFWGDNNKLLEIFKC